MFVVGICQTAEATVVGLEAHLTMPSRLDKGLVDHWVAISLSGCADTWQAAFKRFAFDSAGCSSYVRSVEVVRLTTLRGWIVARGVDRARIAPHEVEAEIRAMVTAVNSRISLVDASEAHQPSTPLPARLVQAFGRIDFLRRLTQSSTMIRGSEMNSQG